MNILQINTADTRGGAAKVAYLLNKEYGKMGHTTNMLVGRKHSSDKNVYLLNDIRSLSGRVRKKLAFYLANDIDVFTSDHLLKMAEFKEADVVHCHNLHSYYFNLNTLKKISKLKPVIWTFHDMWPITAHCAHSFGGNLKNGFFQCPSLDIFPPIAWHNEKYLESKKKEIYENSKFHIVTPSHWLKELVGQSILKNMPISLIHNGIDTNIFKPYPQESIRHELNLPKNKKIILSVIKNGKNNPWKGSDYITKMARYFDKNDNLVFVNIGSNDNELAPKIVSIPQINNETLLAKYYSAADILLYPSIADNCPLVVLEAQACGLPVVGFETGGIPEIVRHGETGYMAQYKNENELQVGLNFILDLSNEDALTMRQKSVENIKNNFGLKKMADEYLSLYHNLL